MPLVVVVLYNVMEDALEALREPPICNHPIQTLSCEITAMHNGEDVKVPHDACDEFDVPTTVMNYKRFFEDLGHTVVLVPGDYHVPDRLRELFNKGTPADICWNVTEGIRGHDRECQMPALLEMLAVPYSFPPPLAHALSLNKAMLKRLFYYYGIPTPAFQEFFEPDEPLSPELASKYPLFVKPNSEGTGIGISTKSLVHNEKELREQLKEIIGGYHLSALVEEFIPGRDVTCGVIGNIPSRGGHGLTVLEVNEVDYEHVAMSEEFKKLKEKGDEFLFYTNEVKGYRGDDFHAICPAIIPKDVEAEIKRLTVQVFNVCQGRDAGRVDFRLDTRNGGLKPIVIEINTLPGMMEESDLTVCARGCGCSHERMVHNIFACACERYGLEHNVPDSERLAPNV